MKSRLETLLIGFLIVLVGAFSWYKLDERATRMERSNEVIQSFVTKQSQQTILLKIIHEKLKDTVPVETKVRLAQNLYSIAIIRNVPLDLACGLIEVESGWNPRAQSGAGAFGLTQTLISTAKPYLRAERLNYSPDVLFDPCVSVLVGISFLADLQESHVEMKKTKADDFTFALHSYFWGPSATKQLYGLKDERVSVPNLSYPMRVLAAAKKYKEQGL